MAPSRRHLLVEKKTILAQLIFFFRNKTICQDWNCNFQHLFELEFCQLTQVIQKKKNFISVFSMGCLNELKFCFTKSQLNQKLKLSVLYLDKQKSFIPKKNEPSQEWTGFNIKTTSFVYRPNFGVKILEWTSRKIKIPAFNPRATLNWGI